MSLDLVAGLNLPPAAFSSLFERFSIKSKTQSLKIKVVIFEVENCFRVARHVLPPLGEEEAGSRRKWTSNRLVQVDFQPLLFSSINAMWGCRVRFRCKQALFNLCIWTTVLKSSLADINDTRSNWLC